MKYFKNINPYESHNMTDFIIHKGNKISSKAIVDDDRLEMRFFSAAKGESIDKELFFEESLFNCLSGKLLIQYKENDEIELNPGEFVVLEHNIEYGLEVLENSKFFNILYKNK